MSLTCRCTSGAKCVKHPQIQLHSAVHRPAASPTSMIMSIVTRGKINQFSEANLKCAVYDDTEKKVKPMYPRTKRTALRELLQEGKFKSPSKAILKKTVADIKNAEMVKQRRNKELYSKMKMRAMTKVRLRHMNRFMNNLAEETKVEQLRKRREAMGLPPDMKLKLNMKKPVSTTVSQVSVVRGLQGAYKHPSVKLPDIYTRNTKLNKTSSSNSIPDEGCGPLDSISTHDLASQFEGDVLCDEESDGDDTRSYAHFICHKMGSASSLPVIDSSTRFIVPTRTPKRKKRSIKVASHLERFRYMRIKN